MDWISVRTQEADIENRRDWTLSPKQRTTSTEGYFSVNDPFNVRKAVVPLFDLQADGNLTGLGTAFGVASKGTLLTADHVISDYRDSASEVISDGRLSQVAVVDDRFLVAFLSPGLIFGTVHIPAECFPQIVSSHSPTKEGDDPMRELRGESNVHLADISVLGTQSLGLELHTLRFCPNSSEPNVGDKVVAVGFPRLNVIKGGRQEVSARLEEGMFASYGTVVALHPNGRDQSNQTPVFEVETHWPPGMSGGPVFSDRGEVIGVVSRSLEARNGLAGRGWATWLGRLPELKNLLRYPQSFRAE